MTELQLLLEKKNHETLHEAEENKITYLFLPIKEILTISYFLLNKSSTNDESTGALK